jgi:hypothetical protein
MRAWTIHASASLALCALAGLAGADTLELPAKVDVNGARGRDGSDGSSGSGYGGDGGDAGPSSSGNHAGSLDLEIASVGSDDFVVRGAVVPSYPQSSSAPSAAQIERTYRLGESGSLGLLARGGDGGHGGDGGNGSSGAPGSDGSDASCYSSGSSGGRGGNGGDGGDATSGSPGGRGGQVTVTLSEDDTHLLLLLDHDVAGGAGGRAGSNGSGGSGGRGGRGGRSHSSHGSGDNRCSGRSGGSDGPSGSSGSSGSAHVSAGGDGGDGRWTIRIGEQTYGQRYQLKLDGFTITSDNRDGVIEPGERVFVSGIAMANRGEVPTPPPALHETHVYLPLTRNVIEPSVPLTAPWVLASQAADTLPGELAFSVPDIDVASAIEPNVRYRDEGLADPRARLPHAHRDYPEFQNAQTFPIGFPVGVRPLRLASAYAAGESHRFTLEVENLSSKPFGREVEGWERGREQTPDPRLARVVELTFRFEGGTLGPEDMLLHVGSEQTPFDLAQGPVEWEILALGPGEVARLELALGVKPGTAPYAGAHLGLELGFGQLQTPLETRVVERRRLPLRVAARWQEPAEPSLLLVTNVGVEREVVVAWRELAAALGLGLAIWDVSYYGFLPLGARVEDRSDALLMDSVPNQPVVVLNNGFSSPELNAEGQRLTAHASSLLVSDHVARAARAQGVHVLSLGGGRAVSASLAPTRGGEREEAHGSEAAFLDWVASHGDADDVDVVHRLPGDEGWFWGEPNVYDLSRLASGLSETLASRWPDRRYQVVYRQEDTALDDGVFWNSMRHGWIDVRRLPDCIEGVHDQLQIDDETLQTAAYLRDPQLLTALFGSFTFARKLELLEDHFSGELPRPGPGAPSREVFGFALGAAIVSDLHAELDRWTDDAWSGLSLTGTYRERMRFHAALAALELEQPLAADSVEAACARMIVEQVKARGALSWDWSDVVVPFMARRYLASAAATGTAWGSGHIDDFAERVLGDGVEAAELEAEASASARGAWPYARGHQQSRRAYERVASESEWNSLVEQGERVATKQGAFLEALDRLHAESFMAEDLGSAGD